MAAPVPSGGQVVGLGFAQQLYILMTNGLFSGGTKLGSLTLDDEAVTDFDPATQRFFVSDKGRLWVVICSPFSGAAFSPLVSSVALPKSLQPMDIDWWAAGNALIVLSDYLYALLTLGSTL